MCGELQSPHHTLPEYDTNVTHHNELKGFVLWNTYEREKIKQCLDEQFKDRPIRVVALSNKLELQAITVMAQMLIEAAELEVEVRGHDDGTDDFSLKTDNSRKPRRRSVRAFRLASIRVPPLAGAVSRRHSLLRSKSWCRLPTRVKRSARPPSLAPPHQRHACCTGVHIAFIHPITHAACKGATGTRQLRSHPFLLTSRDETRGAGAEREQPVGQVQDAQGADERRTRRVDADAHVQEREPVRHVQLPRGAAGDGR